MELVLEIRNPHHSNSKLPTLCHSGFEVQLCLENTFFSFSLYCLLQELWISTTKASTSVFKGNRDVQLIPKLDTKLLGANIAYENEIVFVLYRTQFFVGLEMVGCSLFSATSEVDLVSGHELPSEILHEYFW